MAFRGVRALALATVLAAPLILAACSSGDDAGPTASPTATATGSSTATPSPKVTVDEQVKEALEVKEGEAIIPGSIDSTEQTLSPECTTAVAPLRAAMKKYPSGFSVPEAEKMKLINEDLSAARAKCGDTTQEWTNFYALEFSGWLYAKVD